MARKKVFFGAPQWPEKRIKLWRDRGTNLSIRLFKNGSGYLSLSPRPWAMCWNNPRQVLRRSPALKDEIRVTYSQKHWINLRGWTVISCSFTSALTMSVHRKHSFVSNFTKFHSLNTVAKYQLSSPQICFLFPNENCKHETSSENQVVNSVEAQLFCLRKYQTVDAYSYV